MSRFQGPAFRCDKIVVIVTLVRCIAGSVGLVFAILRILRKARGNGGYSMFRRINERPLTSEPFIENQSEQISKLSLHQSLVKRKFITKRYRRAREPSRISLRFLRRLKNKSSMLKKFLFKRISSILIPKSSKLHRYVKKVRKLYNTRYKCNHKHDPKIFYLIKVNAGTVCYWNKSSGITIFFSKEYLW